MSIKKCYEVSCDVCGKVINRYYRYKPSIKQLQKDYGKVRINNGKVRIMCRNCADTENNKNKMNELNVYERVKDLTHKEIKKLK